MLTKQQQQSNLAAYTNGDYTPRWTSSQFPDDRISHGVSSGDTGDSSSSRPLSQGVESATTSRPATSQGMNSTTPTSTTASAVTPALPGRPESSGTDVGPHPAMRHGFAEAYSSEEYLTMLEQVTCTHRSFFDDRYFTCTLLLIDTKILPAQPILTPPSSKIGDLVND
jgi:hypothetical protein